MILLLLLLYRFILKVPS